MGDLYAFFMAFRFASAPMSLRERFRPTAPAQPDERQEARASQALGKQRGRMSASPAPKAAKAVSAVLRPLLRETGMGLNELKRRWRDIVGESFSKTSPEKLAAGVLTIRAPSALAPFLQQQTPLLMERLRVAGAKVKAVRIEHRSAAGRPAANIGPVRRPLSATEETALAQALDPVADPGLKSALMRLGRAVKQG